MPAYTRDDIIAPLSLDMNSGLVGRYTRAVRFEDSLGVYKAVV